MGEPRIFDPGTLRISGLSKSYGRRLALADVTFSIRPREVLGLIGPNGAGKTTLFECLAGVLPPSAGVLLEGDRAVDASRRGQLLFYMPDGIAPWPSQTVRWALEYTIGLFRGQADRRDEVVQGLALERLLPETIGTLSKGERKRTLLAIALLTPQPFLLVDEPFDGLDLRQSRDLAATLRAHTARGRTLFLSIHQVADAARLCDRFVLLSEGRVRAEGTLAELEAEAARRAANPVRSDLEEVFLALT
jgi:ABC-2 type transport system ATP-binding protein